MLLSEVFFWFIYFLIAKAIKDNHKTSYRVLYPKNQKHKGKVRKKYRCHYIKAIFCVALYLVCAKA